MDVTDTDRSKGLSDPSVWADYKRLLKVSEKRDIPLQTMERFDFYERARKAFAIVHTGETALYGNLILKMGVIPEQPKSAWWSGYFFGGQQNLNATICMSLIRLIDGKCYTEPGTNREIKCQQVESVVFSLLITSLHHK